MFDEWDFDTTGLEVVEIVGSEGRAAGAAATVPGAVPRDSDSARPSVLTRQRPLRGYTVTSPRQPPLRGARRACGCLTAEEHLSGCRRSS